MDPNHCGYVLIRGEAETHQRLDHVKIHIERGSKKKPTCRHTELRHLSSDLRENGFILFKSPGCWDFVMEVLTN